MSKEQLEELKAKLNEHFNNEMRLMQEMDNARASLSASEMAELASFMLNHPHTKQATVSLTGKSLDDIFHKLEKVSKGEMITDLTQKTNEELEDMLMDLCGKLELDSSEVELLKAVEDERERRFEGVKR